MFKIFFDMKRITVLLLCMLMLAALSGWRATLPQVDRRLETSEEYTII